MEDGPPQLIRPFLYLLKSGLLADSWTGHMLVVGMAAELIAELTKKMIDGASPL